jgi:DNA-binding NarL/FixJ family response regulator
MNTGSIAGTSKTLKMIGGASKPQVAGKSSSRNVENREVAVASAAIKIIIADSQAIYRVGTRKIFALEDDIRVVAQAETLGQLLAAVQKFPCDVILFEANITPNPQEGVSEVLKRLPESRIVVLTPEPDEDDTVEYFRRGIRGLINRAISPDLLVKCVRKVAAGETWIDNQSVNWVIEAYRQQAAQLMSPRPKARLSDKELIIISCVTQGMRNKEIAHEIGTTEQVVKNYLRKVYDKLGVSDRLELALYCIHHRLLQQGTGKGQIPPPDEEPLKPTDLDEESVM